MPLFQVHIRCLGAKGACPGFTDFKFFRSSLSPKEVLGRRWRGWVLKVLAEGQLIALGATRPVRAAAKTHRSAGASKTSRSNPRQRTSVIQVCGELVLVLVPVYAVLSDTDSTGKSHIVVYTKSVLVEQTTPAALALTDVSKVPVLVLVPVPVRLDSGGRR